MEDDLDFKQMLDNISDPMMPQTNGSGGGSAAIAAAAPLAHTNSFVNAIQGSGQHSRTNSELQRTNSLLNMNRRISDRHLHRASSAGDSISLEFLFNSPGPSQIHQGKKELSPTSASGGSGFTMPTSQTRPSSNSLYGATMMTGRLRAASDMYSSGWITMEQKSLMKGLILSRDNAFKDELDKAERTQDWSVIRNYLTSKEKSSKSNSDGSVPMDNLSLSEKLMGIENPRKRNASITTPTQRLYKAPTLQGVSPEHLGSGLRYNDATGKSANLTTLSGTKGTGGGGSNVTKEWNRLGTFSKQGDMESRTKRSPASLGSSPPPSMVSATSMALSGSESMDADSLDLDADDIGEDKEVTKLKKNERERRRRLAVSNGFDALAKALKLPQVDKATLLTQAIAKVAKLEMEVENLRAEVARLRAAAAAAAAAHANQAASNSL